MKLPEMKDDVFLGLAMKEDNCAITAGSLDGVFQRKKQSSPSIMQDNMSPKERAIFEAALRDYSATDYRELYLQIAEYTGFSIDDVSQVLSDLTTDKSLVVRAEPMFKSTPQIPGKVQIVQAWYNKGPMWDKSRLPRVW
jgi:hypothetical protein